MRIGSEVRGKRRCPLVPARAAAALACTLPALGAQADTEDEYGFSGMEIYEFEADVAALRSGDVNGDGMDDLVFVNPARSRIEVLVRLDPSAPDQPDEFSSAGEPNPIEYDARFELRRRPEERRVLALDLGDFNGDGIADIAYATDTGELVIVRNAAEPGAEEVESRRLDEMRSGCEHLVAADLDQDGFDDVLIVADGALLRLPCSASGVGEPAVLDRMEDGVDRVHVGDLDGDGRPDLIYALYGEEYPFRLRFGSGGGAFGPRTELDLPKVRATHTVDLDADGRTEVVCVFQSSGRIAVLRLGELDSDRRNLARYHIGAAEDRKEDVGFAVGDLDGNGLADVVVADPGAARVALHLGREGEGHEGQPGLRGRDFASLVGVRDPCIGDLDGDGSPELVVCSEEEKMIGVARLDGDRLPFPRTIAVEGEPVAMDVADMDADGRDDVVVVTSKGEGRAREFSLQVMRSGADGGAESFTAHELTACKKAPSAIRAVDLDRDGATDVVAFFADGRSTPLLLVQRGDEFVSDVRAEDAPGLGILAGAGPRAMSYGDCDGDGQNEILVSSNNFARSLYFEWEGDRARPVVLEQFNGPAPDSAVESGAIVDLEGDGRPEVVLFDGRTRELLVLERDDAGGTRLRARVEAGRMRLRGLAPADMNGDGAQELVCLAEDQFGVLYARGDDVTLVEAAFHEPEHARIFVHALASADLDADGRPDVVACETSRNALLVLGPEGDELEHRLGFKVFDQKSFSNRGTAQEPREVVASDFTADGKEDLAVLVHDKLILYVQE